MNAFNLLAYVNIPVPPLDRTLVCTTDLQQFAGKIINNLFTFLLIKAKIH